MPRTVSQVLVEQLGDWGVQHVFGVAGETVLGLLDAIRHQDRVRFIATQDERAAAFAASAYGKLTSRPAACLATGGPGATSLMTGVYDAWADGSPLLALTGNVRRSWEHEDAWQEIDEHALFAPVSVFNAEVETPSQAPLLLAGALHDAVSRRGVAHLSLPADIQTMQADIDPVRPEGHLSWSPAAPSPEGIRQAARLLGGASRPLILAGSGAAGTRDVLLELANRLGAPILTTCRSKGEVPSREPLSMGVPGLSGTPLASDLLREADTILVVGCSLSQNTTGDWQLIRPQQQIVQIDIDRSRIGRLFPVEVGLWADAAPTLRQLVSALPDGRPHTSWGDLARRKRDLEAQIDQKAAARTVPIKPQLLVRALQEALPAESVIALDGGDHAYFMCQQYQAKGERFVMSYHLGSTGFALPAAFAACLAFPERTAVAVVGDAGLSSCLGELISAAQYGLPVLVVCFDNARLGMIASEEERLGMAPFYAERPAVDYGAVARDCGIEGLRVEEPGALDGALHQALAARRPFLLDVAVDPLERRSTALEAAPAMAGA